MYISKLPVTLAAVSFKTMVLLLQFNLIAVHHCVFGLNNWSWRYQFFSFSSRE